MNRTIKITEQQLTEVEDSNFTYIDPSNDTTQYDGTSKISASGKINTNNFGNPVIGDEISNSMTPQSYYRYRMHGNNTRLPLNMVENNIDVHYKVADIGNGLNTLSDGDNSNNLMRVPKGVENKSNILLKTTKSLTPKQQAMVLNKQIEQSKIDEIPYAWKKELMMKIMKK